MDFLFTIFCKDFVDFWDEICSITFILRLQSATIKNWISILEASGIIYLLEPYTPTYSSGQSRRQSSISGIPGWYAISHGGYHRIQ